MTKTSRAALILETLRAGPFTPNALAERLNLQRDVVQDTLFELKDRGLAHRIDEKGAGRGAVWAAVTTERPFDKRSERLSPWTPDVVNRVVALWDAGVSASMIAAQVRLGLTRSGITGRLNRMGLLGKARGDSDRGLKQRIAARRVREARPKRPVRPIPPKPISVPPAIVPPVSDGPVVPLMALLAHHCRWPIGDPAHAAFGFCGVRKEPGRPYCLAHGRVAAQERKAGSDRVFRLERLA